MAEAQTDKEEGKERVGKEGEKVRKDFVYILFLFRKNKFLSLFRSHSLRVSVYHTHTHTDTGPELPRTRVVGNLAKPRAKIICELCR